MKRLLVLSILVASSGGFSIQADPVKGPSPPNIVIIVSDDQRWDTVSPTYMPRLNNLVIPNAIVYPNSFVPNAVCCPSRASILTGTHSHTNGVYTNAGAFGGFRSFTLPPEGHSPSAANETHTIATDLQAAGYRTGLVGKYLNGYPAGHYTYVPPGWDRWFSVATGVYYDYFSANNGHRSKLHGSRPKDYITRVLTERALQFIDTSTDPFFLYFSATAPHEPATPDPRDVDRFNLDDFTQPPSWGQTFPSDPLYIKSGDAKWKTKFKQEINGVHAAQLNATYGLDRAIGKIWNALPDNTVVVFLSDNGYMWGEHQRIGKQVPYNESIRVPIILAGKNLADPIDPGTDPDIVLNVDLLPTLEALAGVTPSGPVDGLNMLTSSRPNFVLEHFDGDESTNRVEIPTYCGVRSVGWMYARYSTDEEVLYDESTDPYELTNLAVTDPTNPQLATLRQQAAALCQGGDIYPPGWIAFPSP